MQRLTTTLALWAGLTACAQAAEPITLGFNYPRTGPYKEEGLAQMRGALLAIDEIGRASCRERVEISVVAVSLKKKDGIRDLTVTGVQTCALPISRLQLPAHRPL